MRITDNPVIWQGHATPLWESETTGNGGAYLLVQNDGNVVIYSHQGDVLWDRWSNQ